MNTEDMRQHFEADGSPARVEGGTAVVVPPGDWFGWFYRYDYKTRDDHVISLCGGHRYLTKVGGWKEGEGDLKPLPKATGCCVCMGTVTIDRMRGAPVETLSQNEADNIVARTAKRGGWTA